jgi:hypothetical protein
MTKEEKEVIAVDSMSHEEYTDKKKEQEALVLQVRKQLDELKMPIKENQSDGIEDNIVRESVVHKVDVHHVDEKIVVRKKEEVGKEFVELYKLKESINHTIDPKKVGFGFSKGFFVDNIFNTRGDVEEKKAKLNLLKDLNSDEVNQSIKKHLLI